MKNMKKALIAFTIICTPIMFACTPENRIEDNVNQPQRDGQPEPMKGNPELNTSP